MNFENKLIPGELVKRYKRFFVDVKLKTGLVAAHCPNTGSMIGLLKPGNKVWLSETSNKKRKLKYTLQIIEVNGSKVGINTHLTNKIFFDSLKNNKIKEFKKYLDIKSEVKFNKDTRFDFLITKKNYKAFIEVKNVTLVRRKNIAEFPDAVTLRGAKHLKELLNAKKKGYDIFLVFVIQRADCQKFTIAEDIDSNYAKLLRKALNNKLNLLCYDCKISPKGIKLNQKINFKI